MRNLLAFAAAAAIASPAAAAWNVAQSKHFVIYANENPRELRDFATKLERFDGAARTAMRMDDPLVGNGNRLTVFVLPSPADVREILGANNWIAGFYTGRVTGSLAYVPRHMENPAFNADEIFFHEYTHHLMMQSVKLPYPEWYVEGFAEFLSTAKIDKDGSVWFGGPLNQRASILLNAPPMRVETLMGGITPKMTFTERDEFYAWGWLLAHYLQMSDKRQGQLNAYIDALADGIAPLAAAQKVFGDLKQLDHELFVYRLQRFLSIRIPAARFQVSAVDVQPLSPGAAQVMPLRAKLKFAPAKFADELLPKLHEIETRYRGDDLVETTLAEAELNAHHPDAALVAADQALKANPSDTEALVFKGRAVEDSAPAEHGPARQAAFDQARSLFIAANKLDTEDPEPLINFYRSFLRQGLPPTDNAVAALHYASDLAPQDLGVRMSSALAYLRVGKNKEARTALTVIAYSPHQNPMMDVAKRMIADIDSGNATAALMETRVPKPSTGL
jgi:tetratricopeptide (TPR) repeat protein